MTRLTDRERQKVSIAVFQKAFAVSINSNRWKNLNEYRQAKNIAGMQFALRSGQFIFATATARSKCNVHTLLGENIFCAICRQAIVSNSSAQPEFSEHRPRPVWRDRVPKSAQPASPVCSSCRSRGGHGPCCEQPFHSNTFYWNVAGDSTSGNHARNIRPQTPRLSAGGK